MERYNPMKLSGGAGGEQPKRKGERMMDTTEKLEKLMDYVQEEGRICPREAAWITLWKMLPAAEGEIPPEPYRQTEGSYRPTLIKVVLLREQLNYAARHGVLDEVDAFLRSLPADEWETVMERGWVIVRRRDKDE